MPRASQGLSRGRHFRRPGGRSARVRLAPAIRGTPPRQWRDPGSGRSPFRHRRPTGTGSFQGYANCHPPGGALSQTFSASFTSCQSRISTVTVLTPGSVSALPNAAPGAAANSAAKTVAIAIRSKYSPFMSPASPTATGRRCQAGPWLSPTLRAQHSSRSSQPRQGVTRYTIPMPEDSPLRGRGIKEVALGDPVLSTVDSGGPNLTEGSTTFELVFAL